MTLLRAAAVLVLWHLCPTLTAAQLCIALTLLAAAAITLLPVTREA